MKKLIILMSIALFATKLIAQPVLEVSAGQSYPVKIGVTNAVTSNFTWTKPADPNSIITNAFPLTTLNADSSTKTLTISGTALNLQQATVRVVASSVTGSCASTASDLIVRVSTPTFTAAIAVDTQKICAGNTIAAITVNLTSLLPATINFFTYYIDANNNGTQDLPGESSNTVNVGAVAPTSRTITIAAAFPTAGTQAVRVLSVNGTITATGEIRNSPQTGVAQIIKISAIPVLGNFSY